jgi:tetratricopeptide (TPR) repeat protein
VASQYLNLANLAHARHDRAGVERLHAKALAIRRELFPDPHPDIVNSQLTYGKMLLDYGDSASAIEPLTEALLLCRQLFDPDHPPSKEALMLLQRALKDQGRLDELPQLIAAADAAPNAKGGWAAPHELLARLARDRGDFSLAIAHYSRALDSLRRQTNPPPDKLVATLAGISDVYQRQGRLGLALPFLREEHALNRTRLQARPHEFVQRAGAFSDALFQQKQTNEVVAVLGEMRSALARLPDASEVEWARLEGRESRALTLQGRLEEAERLARSAIARARSLGPEPAEILATSLDALTVVQRARGDAAGDLATRREAFAIREAMFGKDSPRMADPCFALGEALERAGQREEAARYFLQAWDFKQRDPAASRNFTPVALAQRLVELYEALQQPEQATVWKKKLAALTPPKSAAAPKP